VALPAVLVHSPLVGPLTWVPCARVLQACGVDAVVPDLRHVGAGGPPYWPRVVEAVVDAMGQLDEPGPVTVVAHSNAGVFVPTLVDASPRRVEVVVLVDAVMPGAPGPVPVAPEGLLSQVRALAGADGRLPRWTDWWSPEDVGSLLPDADVRRAVADDQPRLPVDYFEQVVPVPAGWPPTQGAYLQFTAVYDSDAARARSAGWVVQRMSGGHLHQVVDPVAVADAVMGLARRVVGARPGPSSPGGP
jgi:hypothetical protein